MRNTNDRPAAPNYTLACIVMFGVNLTWVLMLVWVIWGLIAAAATGWAVSKVINRIEAERG